MPYLVAFDQGTTSSRTLVFRRDGSIAGAGQREFKQIFPQPGWVEHDPEEIWSSQLETAAEALNTAGIHARDVTALGITNQRETTLVWDRATGEPVYNAIVWQDRRTATHCEDLRSRGIADTFYDKTGLLLDPYFSGTKIAWILDHVEGARTRAERGELAFGTVDTWLVHRLTAGALHITDPSNASRTLLYNIHTNEWDDELLEIMGVPRSMLAEVRSSSEIYGSTATAVLGASVPLAGIIGDQQAATAGQVCAEPGLAKNTYGTGSFLLLNTGERPIPSKNRLLTTIGWQIDGRTTYCLEGSVFVGGAIVQWLRDGLGIVKSAAEIESLARRVDHADGVFLVPALTGLGAPHWDPHARGTIVGLTRGSTAAHIARAALDGIAYGVYDLVSAMEADSGTPLAELRVDGGAAANNLLLQFQADILQVPVVRPTTLETTALGAAYMAGLASGLYASFDDVQAHWQVDRRFEPAMSADHAESLRARWHDAVERSKHWER